MALLAVLYTYACAPSTKAAGVGASDAPSRVYVPPGSYDEFYAFMSGGFSGQVGIYGLPSGRLLQGRARVSAERRKRLRLQRRNEGDVDDIERLRAVGRRYHPSLSMTGSMHDGKWLFINGNNTPRMARIDLNTFETTEISSRCRTAQETTALHTPPKTPSTSLAERASRTDSQKDVAISDFAKEFKGAITFIKANDPGKMDIAFQVLVPGFDYDLARPGKASAGWVFFSSYNTEQAYTSSKSTRRRTTKTTSWR
ncbi:MAG: hypothetical protein U0163_04085 [Gemmatimonadaceae bacterium]